MPRWIVVGRIEYGLPEEVLGHAGTYPPWRYFHCRGQVCRNYPCTAMTGKSACLAAVHRRDWRGTGLSKKPGRILNGLGSVMGSSRLP